jgi:hypothetical protein
MRRAERSVQAVSVLMDTSSTACNNLSSPLLLTIRTLSTPLPFIREEEVIESMVEEAVRRGQAVSVLMDTSSTACNNLSSPS